MTLVALDDDIWSRLYGPYGIVDVAAKLATLRKTWDSALAKTLFWDDLHHQDTLYPVTYAAVPWLWNIAKSGDPDIHLDIYYFLSHFVACCRSLEPRENENYNGLALSVHAHAFSWLPDEKHLNANDILTLKALETWADENLEEIALSCATMARRIEKMESIHLL